MTQGVSWDLDTRPVPAARLTGLVMSEVGTETLVYDTDRHHIHRLNATAAAVWRVLDGRRTMREVVRVVETDLGTTVGHNGVQAALIQLDEAKLLDTPLPAELSLSGQSRRKFMKRAAMAGAGAGAGAAIVSMTAPAAAQATSGCSNTCSGNNSNCCDRGGGILRATLVGCVSINAGGGSVFAAACAAVCV
jgi:hypothetical protein